MVLNTNFTNNLMSLTSVDPRVALLQFGTFCDRLSSARTNTSLLSQSYIIAGEGQMKMM